MRAPPALFRFIAKAALSAFGGGLLVDFAVEVLPDLALDVWKRWKRDRPEGELRAELQSVSQLTIAETIVHAEKVAQEEGAGRSETERQALASYLTLLPNAIRKARPSDLSLRRPEDLLLFLPRRKPRFESEGHATAEEHSFCQPPPADVGLDADDVFAFIGDPGNVYIDWIRACIDWIRGDSPRAEDDYKRAFVMGRMCLYEGEYATAVTAFTEALQFRPDDVHAYNSRGEAHLRRGDYGGAIADFNRSISLDPNSSFAYRRAGETYINKGEYEYALNGASRIPNVRR